MFFLYHVAFENTEHIFNVKTWCEFPLEVQKDSLYMKTLNNKKGINVTYPQFNEVKQRAMVGSPKLKTTRHQNLWFLIRTSNIWFYNLLDLVFMEVSHASDYQKKSLTCEF